MKTAFLYAGQGSQKPGMGLDLYEGSAAARKILDEASGAVDFDLRELSFRGPMETLSLTQYTQPCMVAFAAAVTALFREAGVAPDFAAGLSLGEYSALACAGVLEPAQAVRLVRFRGQAMERAVAGQDTAMTAVLGISREALREVCREASQPGSLVEIANCNCPGQTVVGGHRPAVERASALAMEQGAKRCIPLNVSAAFHTSLLEPAARELEERFREELFGRMKLPVVFNATARPLGRGETIPQLLVRQVKSPTLMEDTIRWLAEQGVDTVVEIGPGKVLSGFVKKTVPGIRTLQAEDLAGVEEAIQALKGE